MVRRFSSRQTDSGEAFAVGEIAQAFAQLVKGAEVEITVAPLQDALAFEIVVFQALDGFLFKTIGLSRHAESAIIHVAPGAARDLAQFGRREIAIVESVKLARGGKGDMVHVHVEAHADGVCGHQIVHIA
jgi:hypothetical protein